MNIQTICLTTDAFQKHLQHTTSFYSHYNTIIGTLTLLSTQLGIYNVVLSHHTSTPDVQYKSTIDYTKIILVGTPFQQKVWQATLEIQSGATSSYQDLAQKIGHPMAARAVANALAANRIAYFIPCHRVIRSTGKLGGYTWGIELKRLLLQDEQRQYTHPLFV